MICAGVISSVFNPKDLPDIYRWYDVSETSTLTSTNIGGETYVTAINDKSGNGYHATQTVSDNTPRLETSKAGLPSLDMFRSNKGYYLTDARINSQFDFTTFYVLRKGTSQGDPGMICGASFCLKALHTGFGTIYIGSDNTEGDGVEDFLQYDVWGASGNLSTGGTNNAFLEDPANTGWVGPTDVSTDIDYIICHRAKHEFNAGGTMTLWKNNDHIETMTPPNAMARKGTITDTHDNSTFTGTNGASNNCYHYLGIGANSAGNTDSTANRAGIVASNNGMDYKGHIMEVLDYGRYLSDQEVQTILGHLMGKWRVS